MQNPKHILITGSSSGLGAELAKQYAAPGVILYLLARNKPRLDDVAQACRRKGADVRTKYMDIREGEMLGGWVTAIDREHPLDLVIANAGISAGTGGGGESATQVKKIFDTNIDGVMYTIQPLLPAMRVRGQGHIVIISSLASYRGLPSSPAYSASKAAVRVYGEALRGLLKKQGITVSVVMPGYIKTPMTAVNTFPMPFCMDAAKAANIIRRGIARNAANIIFPWPMYLAVKLASVLPAWLTDPLFSRLPDKPSEAAQVASNSKE